MNIPPTPVLSSPSPTLRRDHRRGKPPRGQRGAGNQAGGEGPGHQGRRATGPVTGRGSENVGSAIVLSGTRPRTTQRLPPPLSPRILRRPASVTPDSPLSQSLTSLESTQETLPPQPLPRCILASPAPSVGSGIGNVDLSQQMETLIPRLDRIRVSQASGTVPHGPTASEIEQSVNPNVSGSFVESG